MKIEIEVSDALPQSGQLRDLFDQVVGKLAALITVAWHDGAIYGLDKADQIAKKHFGSNENVSAASAGVGDGR